MVLSLVPAEKKGEGRSRIDRENDNQQLLQLEEKDVVSSVATVLSDLCGPGEWMPMDKLHTEVSLDHFMLAFLFKSIECNLTPTNQMQVLCVGVTFS